MPVLWALQGAPSDVWAAGCVAFALLRLRLPFVSQAGDTDEMVRRTSDPRPPTRIDSPLLAASARPSPPHTHRTRRLHPLAPRQVRLRILRAEPRFDGTPDEPPLSEGAAAFCRRLLWRDWRKRCTASEALGDSWLLATVEI